ncbi:hypothetical protein ACFSC6_12360 [Rufibacter sediminis]|uniref:Uncharacterized protein n=1 Tax=Rufibacter sediminis TaxID=2762756 RepID=A0ABR6VTZ7_9BACT|nr:hypothetical protein [Rufibacter sediminis]MBC3540676.1 hypothetical protein [Rufibacter sediminis]
MDEEKVDPVFVKAFNVGYWLAKDDMDQFMEFQRTLTDKKTATYKGVWSGWREAEKERQKEEPDARIKKRDPKK